MKSAVNRRLLGGLNNAPLTFADRCHCLPIWTNREIGQKEGLHPQSNTLAVGLGQAVA